MINNQQPNLLEQEEGSTTKDNISNNTIKHEIVRCQLCIKETGKSKGFKILDIHLRKYHNLTRDQYLDSFPGALIVSDSYRENFQGKVAWNKGLTKETNKSVAKNALGTSSTRQKLSAEGNLPIWNRGLSAEDNLVWKQVCDKAHEARRGQTAWNNGLTKDTDERVAKNAEATSKTLLERHANGELSAWNKGLDVTDPRVKENVEKRRITLRRRIAEGKIIPNNTVNYYNHFKAGYREDLGHFVRSSWEANFARILNLQGLVYEYEATRFVLEITDDEPLTYLPDFYIPSLDIFFEVKGRETDTYLKKIKLFYDQYPEVNLCVVDGSKYKCLKRTFSKVIDNWEY
jgi:predicted transcriptional regulator